MSEPDIAVVPDEVAEDDRFGPPEVPFGPVEPEDDTPEGPGVAPPVVVAMVAHEPGDWFEEALQSLADQDYPNLSVLVMGAGENPDLLSRVAAVLPSAYVRTIEGNPGFSAAANEVLGVVEGASFYLFCHDDVALAPDAIRHLVEEALRSNASIVGPKLVDWDDPNRLLEVGLAADKTGVVASLVEPGELDQEQHDSIRDVFLIPTACMLIRSDLFGALGGFDTVIPRHGEDLDLCWRAQVAGARVVVVPDARVRHRARLDERIETDETTKLRARHRLRTVLTCYGRWHLLRVLPQALVYTVAEVVIAAATGRFSHANDMASAWSWNLGRLKEIRARRRDLKAIRRITDGEVRLLQAHGSARLSRFVRGEFGSGSAERVRDSLAGVGRELTESFTSGSRRFAFAAWMLAVLVVLVGSRGLIVDRIPLVAGFAPVTQGPFDLLRDYLSGWHRVGVGSEAPVPTAVALLGLAELPLLGGRGLLQLLLVVGMLPLGAIGAWRLSKPLGSSRARAVGLAIYVANPLPYDALARGAWGGLLLYGAAPWLVARVFRAVGDDPFARAGDRLASIVGLGLVLALVTAFVPVAAPLLVLVALAVLVGSLLAGGARAALAALLTTIGASLVAALLHLPWTLDFTLPGADWWAAGGVSPMGVDRVGLGDLLRFQVGAVGVPLLGWAVPLAAVLPLLIAREWRFRWAVRCWTVAVGCWVLAWTGTNGMLPFELPSPHVVLAPAAVALSLAAALGILAFEVDLRGYRFGIRQAASIASALLAAVALVPAVVAAADGRWHTPSLDLGRTLTFLGEDGTIGGSRTLWIGDPEVLPLAGHRLGDDLAYGLSDEGVPNVVDRIATSPSSATELVADALHLVADGRSDRLGRLLAPFGIRYVVLLTSSAPERAEGVDAPLPPGLAETVGRQLDLRLIEVDPAVELFENTAWMPVRALVRGGAATALEDNRLFSTAASTDLSTAVPAVGDIDAGTVHLGVPSSARWHLTVDGDDMPRGKSLGWANRFEVAEGGEAHLSYRTPAARYLAVIAQLILWVLAWHLARRRPQPVVELPSGRPSRDEVTVA